MTWPRELLSAPWILSLVAVSSGFLSGCVSLDPNYTRPAAPVPTIIEATIPLVSIAPDLPANDFGTTAWQAFFVDERLRQVIAIALDNNRDLRIAAENVLAAQALYRVQRAQRVPAIDLLGNGTHVRESGGDLNDAQTAHDYSAGLGITAFELDLFGRVRSLSRAQLEQYFATAAAARSTRISLIAETAAAWLAYAADRSLLDIARETQGSAENSLRVARERQRLGVAAQQDVAIQETLYQQARADVALFSSQVAQDLNALQLLAGTRIDAALLPAGLEQNPYTLQRPPANLPSDVLLSRPDVIQTEHNLKAANADIGAARAAFFPSISLTAEAGVSSTSLSGLFDGPTRVLSFSPAINLPIFSGGATLANLDYAKAQRNAAVANYEKAIQNAFREVADALARRATIGEQLDAQRGFLSSTQRNQQIADARYKLGTDSYLNALETQRTVYAARQNLVSGQLVEATNLVTLYRVLGGGAE